MTYRFYLFRIILQRIYYRNHVILLLETLYPPASFATFTPNLHSQLTVCSLYVSYLTLEGQDTLAAASSLDFALPWLSNQFEKTGQAAFIFVGNLASQLHNREARWADKRSPNLMLFTTVP